MPVMTYMTCPDLDMRIQGLEDPTWQKEKEHWTETKEQVPEELPEKYFLFHKQEPSYQSRQATTF